MSAKATGGPTKPRKPEDGVLGSLSSTRPNRMGRRARSEPAAKVAATKAKRAPKAKPAAAKPPTPAPEAAKSHVAAVPDPAPTPRPKAIRAGAPKLKAHVEPPRQPKPSQQSGTELVTTVVQAAGELAQIGLTVSGQVLKRIAERLPRP